MKILHIVSNLSVRNGVMSVLMNYYRNMDTKNFTFEFIYFDDREVTYKEEIERLGGKVQKLERSRNPFKLFKEINDFINKHITEFNIIHIHEIYLIGALIGIKHKNKNIKIIAHGHATKFSDNRVSNIRNRIMSIPNIMIPDYYFACSKKAGNLLFGKRFKKIGCVINNAIDLSKFKKDDEIRKKMREELKISDKYVIGHIGNFNAQKNRLFLIDIFYELQKKNEQAILVLVGDGEKRNSVLQKCKELNIDDKVIYLGTRNDINNIMNCFDCFVLPSIYEGLGIVLIEAQASGIPCVFSDTVPEEANILKDNNVILSLQDIPEVWADAVVNCIKEKINEQYQKVSDAGFDIKIEVKKLERYYEKIYKGELDGIYR